MRLNAQLNLGYYPAPPAAVRALAGHLTRGGDGPTALLDPCAGEGQALALLAEELGIGEPHVYAIELDETRAERVRELFPAGNVLGPCSFLSAQISPAAFGLAYCNPPFDDEMGGGDREELRFAAETVRLLRTGGILALVLPEGQVNRPAIRDHLDCWYEDLACYAFPAGHRPFREVVVLGRRRRHPLACDDAPSVARGWPQYHTPDDGEISWRGFASPPELGSDDRTWGIPPAPGPKTFLKRDLTPQELLRSVARSNLHLRNLAPRKPRPRVRPPLAPNDGHIAILIAAGHLDGIVQLPGEPPHVVRGTSRKERFLASQESAGGAGKETTTEVWAERVINLVRTVEAEGTIRTFEE